MGVQYDSKKKRFICKKKKKSKSWKMNGRMQKEKFKITKYKTIYCFRKQFYLIFCFFTFLCFFFFFDCVLVSSRVARFVIYFFFFTQIRFESKRKRVKNQTDRIFVCIVFFFLFYFHSRFFLSLVTLTK